MASSTRAFRRCYCSRCLKLVVEACGFKRKPRVPYRNECYARSDFVELVKRLRAGNPGEILHAAIRRAAYSMIESFDAPVGLNFEMGSGSIRDVVYYIYTWLKRGGFGA